MHTELLCVVLTSAVRPLGESTADVKLGDVPEGVDVVTDSLVETVSSEDALDPRLMGMNSSAASLFSGDMSL